MSVPSTKLILAQGEITSKGRRAIPAASLDGVAHGVF